MIDQNEEQFLLDGGELGFATAARLARGLFFAPRLGFDRRGFERLLRKNGQDLLELLIG